MRYNQPGYHRQILLIFSADAISIMINATETARYTKPFEQVGRTQFMSAAFNPIISQTALLNYPMVFLGR